MINIISCLSSTSSLTVQEFSSLFSIVITHDTLLLSAFTPLSLFLSIYLFLALTRLIKHGHDVNEKHPLGWTALHVAAVSGSERYSYQPISYFLVWFHSCRLVSIVKWCALSFCILWSVYSADKRHAGTNSIKKLQVSTECTCKCSTNPLQLIESNRIPL